MRSFVVGGTLLLVAQIAAARPKPGEAAPAFSLPTTDGKVVRSSELKGKRPVVLAFFPRAFTPG